MNLEWIYVHWIAIAVGVFFLVMISAHFIEARKRKLSEIFSGGKLHGCEVDRGRRFLKWLMLALGLFFCLLCLAEPRYGVEMREVSHVGRDVVFVLDVSRSMLAKDITPTRLRRASEDIIAGAEKMKGHRLGLIAFAGQPKEVCPLTYDYYHFIKRVRKMSPEMISKGGTNIGDALRKAVDLIQAGAKLGNDKDIILITDGQDLQGFYEEIAKRTGALGISIYTVGIGQANKSEIRLADGSYVEHEGKRVTTRLNPEPLQKISLESAGGFYLNLTNNPDWLNDILKHIAQKKSTNTKVEKQERKIPRFNIFLGIGLFFMGLHVLIHDRKRSRI